MFFFPSNIHNSETLHLFILVLLTLKNTFIYCTHTHTHTVLHMYECQRAACRSQFCSSFMWILRNKIQSSGCATGAFYPVSHPADTGNFFLNKTKNTDLPQAEGGLSSFGKNCKQGRPLKTVRLHTAGEQSGSKTDTFLSSLHLLYLTLSTLLFDFSRETQKTGAVLLLHQHRPGLLQC